MPLLCVVWCGGDSISNSPLFSGAQARDDEEHLEHSALQGLQQVSGELLVAWLCCVLCVAVMTPSTTPRSSPELRPAMTRSTWSTALCKGSTRWHQVAGRSVAISLALLCVVLVTPSPTPRSSLEIRPAMMRSTWSTALCRGCTRCQVSFWWWRCFCSVWCACCVCCGGDSIYNSPLFSGAQTRDQEHLEHSSLQGLQQVSGEVLVVAWLCCVLCVLWW